jgi:hypothetical protein
MVIYHVLFLFREGRDRYYLSHLLESIHTGKEKREASFLFTPGIGMTFALAWLFFSSFVFSVLSIPRQSKRKRS